MKIAVEHLKTVCTALLKALGATPREAEIVSENLVLSEMRGIKTHGINYLPKIAMRIEHNQLNVPTTLRTILDSGAVTHIDGNNGLGQVAAEEGMRQSITKAGQFGIGLSLIRNTNNVGSLAFYSSMAATEGMIGFCMCNSAPSMAPWGGAEPFFGTNPFSVSAPSGEDFSLVLDMATSIVARGKIRSALKANKRIPFGWALNNSGVPTENPAEAMQGTLIPIGGPKGYGMAFFIDLFCGLLSGSKYSRDLLTFHEPLGPTGVGATTLAVDIAHFMAMDRFNALIRDYIKAIRESKKADGVDRIYAPGEIEAEKQHISLLEGVDIDSVQAKEINDLLEKMNINVRIEDVVDVKERGM